MARQKVRLADNIARVVFIETNATEGATLGTNLYLPNGVAATPASLSAWLGGTTFAAQATQQAHQLLSGLTAGNDHPQYLLRATLTTDGDLLTRESGSVTRLPIGLEGDVLTVVDGLPAWVAAVVASGVELSEGAEPPPYPEVGWFWWDTYYEALYIYTSLGWYDVSTGTSGTVTGVGGGYDPRIGFVAEDDFLLYPSSSAVTPWIRAESGSGAGISADNFGEAGHPGVLGLETGTTNAGFAGVAYGSRTSSARWSALKLGGGIIQFNALIEVPTAPTGLESFEITIGLGDSITVPFSPINEGIYFRTAATTGKWKYCTRSNSTTVTEVEDATLAIVGGAWVHLAIEIDSAGTEAKFYIDNVLKHTATVTFPTSALTMFATVYKTAGTTERFVYLDYMGVRQDFTSQRWTRDLVGPAGPDSGGTVGPTGPAGPAGPAGSGGGVDPSAGIDISDDFLIFGGATGPWPWDTYVNGTAAAVSSPQGEANAPGILRLDCGTQNSTAAQATALYGSTDATVAHRPVIVGGGEIVFEARVRCSAIGGDTDQYFARFGLVNELSGAPGDGIYFGTVSNSGVWQYTCRAVAASATFTNDASSLTIGTTWSYLKLVINAAGNSVEFFVDGVSRATVTTDIPLVGMTMGVGIQRNSGTTARYVEIDFVRLTQTFTTARW